MTIGAEIRNENVTPSGTPAVTNPMNSGTAEHEQNGVTMPSSAASTLPADSLRPARIRRVRSGVKNERTMPTPNTTSISSISTFGDSKTKNSTAEAQAGAGLQPRESVRDPVRERLQAGVRRDPDDESGACQGQVARETWFDGRSGCDRASWT